MFKIPKYIKNEMKKVQRYSSMANASMEKIEEWLEENGFDCSENGLRDASGCSLEELELNDGAEVVSAICSRIEYEYGKRFGLKNFLTQND